MPALREKLMSLKEAAGLVRSGSTIAFGGMAIRDHPMGFIYELIRQRIGDLTILGWANGNDVDVLVGAGLVKRVDTSYVGLEAFGLAPNFRRGVERREIEVMEYTEVTGVDRFRAGSMAIPFFPVMELFLSHCAGGDRHSDSDISQSESVSSWCDELRGLARGAVCHPALWVSCCMGSQRGGANG